MARSTCMKCDGSRFELAEYTPTSSKFKFQFVQCSSCGGVVGAMDFMNVGAMLEDQNVALKVIAAALRVPVRL